MGAAARSCLRGGQLELAQLGDSLVVYCGICLRSVFDIDLLNEEETPTKSLVAQLVHQINRLDLFVFFMKC